MKKFISLIFILLATSSTAVFAETMVTTTEMGVPITVTNDTYSVVTTPDYYYYSGHRCYVKERPDIGATFLGLNATISGGQKIYCYPYP